VQKLHLQKIIGVFNGDELGAILIHNENDRFNDGDCVTADYSHFPENDEEATFICENSNTTEYFTLENGKYIVNE
jgi:hypothetical protein